MAGQKSKPAEPWRRKAKKQPERTGHSPQAPSLSPHNLIFGLHAAEAALSNPRRTIRSAYLTDNALAKLEPSILARRIPATSAKPAELDALLGGGAVHQGVVLTVEPLEQPDLNEFLAALPENARSAIAVLDQVTDPHNMGAIMRSAAAFGVDALIVQSRHSAPLSAAVAKAASGALEHVPVIEVVNLTQSLVRLKEHGFYCIGFDSQAEAQFGGEAVASPRLAFVFGAEDKGLRRLVGETCDMLCALPAPGPIKSLNVSNAAAIVFYEASKRIAGR